MASQTHHRTRLTREERLGLIVAALAHAGLVAWLALEPPGKPVLPPPERMTVSLAEDVALTATAPEPAAAAPDVAPQLGEPAAEPEPMVAPEPEPRPEPVRPAPQPAPAPRPVPKPAAKPVPKPVSKPAPKPAAKPAIKPAAKAAPKAAEKPAAKPAAKAAAARDERDRRRPDAPSGGSRIGSDFLKGVSSSPDSSGSSRSAASAPGPSAASLSQAIARKLKPHWTAPQGADADKLVTVLAWELSRDGSLSGRPRVVSQSGVTPANEAQKERHAEQAIRAVQLAAPFDLPEEHYTSWRRVSAFRFDRKLSQ